MPISDASDAGSAQPVREPNDHGTINLGFVVVDDDPGASRPPTSPASESGKPPSRSPSPHLPPPNVAVVEEPPRPACVNFVPLFCIIEVAFFFFLRICGKTIASEEANEYIVYIVKGVFYLPAVQYILVGFWRFKKRKHIPLGSFSLRLLAATVVFIWIIFQILTAIYCAFDSNLFKDDGACELENILERAADVLFLAAVARLIYGNDKFARSKWYDILFQAHMLSGTICAYLITMVLEEEHIYNELSNGTHATNTTYLKPSFVLMRGMVTSSTAHKCSGNIECLHEDFLSLIYTSLAEILVASISIIIGTQLCRIPAPGNDAPNQRPLQPPSGSAEEQQSLLARSTSSEVGNCLRRWICIPVDYVKRRKRMMLVIVVLPCFLVIIAMAVVHFVKDSKDNVPLKYVLAGIHCLSLIFGILTCVCYLYLNVKQREGEQKLPTHILDRWMFHFGTAGIISYIFVGLIHCVYLVIIPTYSTLFAWVCFFVNSFSLIEVVLQSIVILRIDIRHTPIGELGQWALILVNLIMFTLDLIDAATLGIYSNPLPEHYDLVWMMLVRGLGPLNVFYRFHSFAMLVEVWEERYEEKKINETAERVHRRSVYSPLEDHYE